MNLITQMKMPKPAHNQSAQTLPSGWREVKLGDVATISSSKRIFHSDYTTSGIPFYRSKEIIEKQKKNNISTKLFITKKKFDDIKSKFGSPQKDDLLLTSVGTLGVPYLVKDNEVFYFKDGNLTWFREYKGLKARFLYYFLLSPIGKQRLNEIAIGSTQRALTIVGLKTISISLPPLSEQKAIAEILSSLDDKIDLLHRQNKTLEDIAQTLFRQWFIEEADMGWEEKPLSYFGDIICGKTPSKKVTEYFGGTIPFIKIPDMHKNTFILDTTDTLSEEGKNSQKNKTLPEKSICVSCIATVGLVSMTAFESQTNQQINSIIPKKEEYRYFLYLFVKSSNDLLRAMASGGTITMNLNTGNFVKIMVPVADENLISKFHGIVKPIFGKIFFNQLQIRTLENLRDTLLPKLMSGEIRMKF